MKRALPLLLLVPWLSSCFKDPVDIGALNTNPLDPDYIGPPMITVLTDSTFTPAAGVFVHYLRVRVDDARFPSSTTYQLRVVDLEDGSTTNIPQNAPGGNTFEHFNSFVTLGQEYCYDLSVYIEFSSARPERHCGIAQL
ncbi:MAG: hypothetical protein JNM31_10095 [Flavobacteriales bacterium]|nr:hypothetical protein [Flavobacteriales bacterium]